MRSRLPFLLSLFIVLPACQEMALVGTVGLIENNNYRTNGRSLAGWAMSAVSEEDCEPMRFFDRQPLCRQTPPPPVEPVCYRSLAAVTCYDRPDPRIPPGRRLPAPGQ